jgi:flagellar basal-body rod protein FlgB
MEEESAMIQERLFGRPVMAALKKSMEGAAVRHEAISNNIANVSTPGYQRQVVNFEDELWRALSGEKGFELKTTHPDHFNGGAHRVGEVTPVIERDEQTNIRIDGNTVNIDQEMAMLTKNSGEFGQKAEILNRMYRQLASAIRGEVR